MNGTNKTEGLLIDYSGTDRKKSYFFKKGLFQIFQWTK